ncbi:MAG: dephospho-CoA kinase [Flavobacteriales bacterium]|nr:dephospho-CoA kinase [Flavobacteriales bacterium]
MFCVGLTGGIGSGKTTVARVFRTLGVPVFEADAEGRRLLNEDAAVREAVVARFGPGVLRDGTIDRAALAGIVFHAPEALGDLNGIIHPAVRASFRHWADRQQAPYVMMEAAILVESGGYKAMDRNVVVTAPEELRIRRVMQRDGVDEQAVRARMANQAGEQERRAIADHVIHNDDTQLVIPQVLAAHRLLLTFAKG